MGNHFQTQGVLRGFCRLSTTSRYEAFLEVTKCDRRINKEAISIYTYLYILFQCNVSYLKSCIALWAFPLAERYAPQCTAHSHKAAQTCWFFSLLPSSVDRSLAPCVISGKSMSRILRLHLFSLAHQSTLLEFRLSWSRNQCVASLKSSDP